MHSMNNNWPLLAVNPDGRMSATFTYQKCEPDNSVNVICMSGPTAPEKPSGNPALKARVSFGTAWPVTGHVTLRLAVIQRVFIECALAVVTGVALRT